MNVTAYENQKDAILQMVENSTYEPIEMAEEMEEINTINGSNHFIKCIVGQYIATRANHISKQFTLDRQDKIIRQQYHHLVNFKGQ